MLDDGFLSKQWNHVAREWHVIMGAKRLFGSASVLLIVGTTIIVWWGARQLYEAEISGKNANIETQKTTIEFLNTKIQNIPHITNYSTDVGVSPKTDVRNLRDLNDDDLRKEVYNLSQSLREMSSDCDGQIEKIMMGGNTFQEDQSANHSVFLAKNQKMAELDASENYEWQTKYRGRAMAVYEELCNRFGIIRISDLTVDLNPDPFRPPDFAKEQGEFLIRTGKMTGSYSINALADYLESLSRQLR